MTVLRHTDELGQVGVGQSLLGLLQPHPGHGEDLEALHHPGAREQVADQREGQGQGGVRRPRNLILELRVSMYLSKSSRKQLTWSHLLTWMSLKL